MAKKTLSIGGATYDLFVRLPVEVLREHESSEVFALPLGAKIRVEDLVETCGGGANNTAVGFARLGCSASFEGVVGSDQWGEKLMENMKRENVDTECATVVEGEVSSFSIILSATSGERVILYDPGTNAHLHHVTFDKHILAEMNWVYLCHIQEDSCEIQDDIVEMLANETTRLTWNPGGCQIEKGMSPANNRELLKHTDVILLNKEEALSFTEKPSVEGAIRALLDAGVKNVFVTDGKRGSIASDGKFLYRCPVVAAEIVDTTGAGDAFGTGVTWAFLQGMSLSDALKTGSINAASVVSAIGAQAGLLRDTQIRKRLKEEDIHVSVDPLS